MIAVNTLDESGIVAAQPSPRLKRPVVLFDRSLKAAWTNAPDFPHGGKHPWEFCFADDVETCKTAFSRCLAGVDAPTLSLCLDLEGTVYRYSVQLSNTGNDELPVIALGQWRDGRLDLLTRRELEVTRLTVAGLSAHEIGATLGCSQSTVDTHRHRVARKLGLPSLVSVGCWAADNLTPEGESL